MKVYNLHSSQNHFFGLDNPGTLKSMLDLAASLGLSMIEKSIPDGLNSYEDRYPNKAVIFDVRSEDVVMVEEGINGM